MQVMRKKAASLLQRLRTRENSILKKAPPARISMVICPTEVLLNIFSYLDPEHLLKCRQVCRRWKSLVEDELLWRRRCQMDFEDNYKAAYLKREEGLPWFGLYRSLSQWSKIGYYPTYQLLYEFTRPPSIPEHCSIYGFQLLSRGEIGINYQFAGVVYYDVATLQESRRENIPGYFIDYVENDDVILLLTRNSNSYTPSNLNVIHKVTRPQRETKSSIPSVKSFFLSDDVVYYVTWKSEEHIYTCNLSDDKLESSLLVHVPGGVENMGHKNGFLYVLIRISREVGIFNIDGACPVRVDIKPNLGHLLTENEQIQNRVSSISRWSWNDLKKSMHSVEVIKIYGDVILIGCYPELLCIYHVPHLENRLDIFHITCEPIIETIIHEGGDFTHIDVMEGNDGPTVLVGMDRQVVVLKFKLGKKSES